MFYAKAFTLTNPIPTPRPYDRVILFLFILLTLKQAEK